MSRSATASTPKNPPQLPSKSAWARGPPQQNSANSTPRSQSPALPTPVSSANPSFHANHSRRPSALGQGVSIKDGVSIPRNAVKQGISSFHPRLLLPQIYVTKGSPVTFGSIDDAPAPISSSPASAPAVKPVEGVKSFGSVAVQNGGKDPAAKSAVTSRPAPLSAPSTSSSSQQPAPPTSTPSPVPKFDKKSIAKLFQGPSTQSVPPPAETASPAARSASLPSQAPQQGQPYVPPFTPGGALRQGQNGNPPAPRSPVYSRPMANGQNNSVGVSGRPQAGSGGPGAGPAPAALPSPRLTPHPPPPGPPSGLPPPPAAMWPGYYVRALSIYLITSAPLTYAMCHLVSPVFRSWWCTPRPILSSTTMAWSPHPTSAPTATACSSPRSCSTIHKSANVTEELALTTGAWHPYPVPCHSTYSPSSSPIRSPPSALSHFLSTHAFCGQSLFNVTQRQCGSFRPREEDFDQECFWTRS